MNISKSIKFLLSTFILSAIILLSCNKKSLNSSTDSTLEVRLTDTPLSGVTGVWVDIKDVQINMGDSGWTSLAGVHTG